MTERPNSVRIACPKDERALLEVMKVAYAEQPTFPLDEERMLEKIRMCTCRKGGVIGVIDGPNGIEGYIIAILAQYWYTKEWHLEELSNFVHPEYRRSTHAKDLINFAKWFAEKLELPLLLGILSTQRLEGKIRLYRRQARMCGAVFICNSGHDDDLLTEQG